MAHTDDLFRCIYDSLNGVNITPTSPIPVEDAFAQGEPCEVLYGDVLDCKIRLNDRLNEEENPDIERIIDNLLEIAEILSRKMFEYGMKI